MSALQPRSDATLVTQLVTWVTHRIDEKVFRMGMRMPSIRQLADEKGVSRFTVVEAYDRLVAQGLLESRRGSGFYVRNQPASLQVPSRVAVERPEIDVNWLLRTMHQSANPEQGPGWGFLPAEWLDGELLASALRSLGRQNGAQFLSAGTVQGYLPLRQQLQKHLAENEIGAQPEQIVMTSGISQSLDLLARQYLQAGDTILVGDPAWFSMFARFAAQGVRMVGVPYREDGPDVAKMAELAAQHRPKLLIINSVLQNPTGLSLSAAQAFQILQLAEQYDFKVVEDDIYSDLAAPGAIRLASLDQLKRVIYLGSFSKTLAANLRVGYIACATEVAKQLSDHKMLVGLTSPEINERVLLKVLTEGHYRKHVERLRQRIAQERDAAQQKLEAIGLRVFSAQSRGMLLWMDTGHDANAIAADGHEAGFLFAPGSLFSPSQQPSTWMRFNVATSQAPQMLGWLARRLQSGT